MPPKNNNNNKKFATFADLNSSSNDRFDAGSPSERPEERDLDDLYAGGEKSGLAVINPNNRGEPSSSGPDAATPAAEPRLSSMQLVDEMLRHAQENRRRLGDDDDDSEESEEEDEEEKKKRAFKGKARSLKAGGSAEAEENEDDNEENDDFARQLAAFERARQTRVTRNLTIWRNGFTVEDGPLYRYDDPANIPHLRAMEQGLAPLSLLNALPGQDVDLNIIQKKHEDYVPPKPKPGGYHGAGRRLGSPVPGEAAVTHAAPEPSGPSATTPAAAASSAPKPSDEDEGDALVQLRLADGSRHKHRFQSSGSVEQLYTFVEQIMASGGSNPAGRGYVLQTTFPNRVLSDKAQGLKDAGVIGAVVVQKWSA